MRIALLTYRGKPHSGGQGVYVRYLSRALAGLGHHVTVFSGPPYPVVDDGVALVEVPSLDLYRPDDPFRTPAIAEFRSPIDALEFAIMCTAGFPEPLTFTLRVNRLLQRSAPFDVVHDNQSLGYGLLTLQRRGVPVVATIHHPCSVDARLALASAPDRRRALSLRRWYAFTKMQGRVARRLPHLIAVSQAARRDAVEEFGVSASRVRVVHNGVDTDLFRPLPEIARVTGRVITTASADAPLKGLVHLIEAIAKLRTERDVELVVIGNASASGPVEAAIGRFGVADGVRFETAIDWTRMVELYAQAEVAVVPSLYEGFSLPAAEAMACAVALVATRAGALPEVVGDDGEAALLVPPGDAGALAAAIGRLLDDQALRARIGAAGRRRVLRRFSWDAAAAATVASYREVAGRC